MGRPGAAVLAVLLAGCAQGSGLDGGRRGDGFVPGDDLGMEPDLGGDVDLGAGIDLGSVDLGTDFGPVDFGPPPPTPDGGCASGTTLACTTTCGSAGLSHCAAGTYGPCIPPGETCNGADDDCDGVIDDGLTRSCSSACGGGTEHCASGAWVGCTAPPAGTETCNGVDDDCDGAVDEGFGAVVFDPVAISEISAYQPACTGTGSAINVCLSAVKRWCVGRPEGCFVGGAGFLQASGSTARVVCFSRASGAMEEGPSYADLDVRASTTITDSNVATRVAESAADRYCRGTGWGSGVGPVEWSGGNTAVTCLPSGVGTYTGVPTGDLSALGCDPLSSPDAFACNTATDSWCRTHGHLAGYGPTEWNATDSGIVCFDAP